MVAFSHRGLSWLWRISRLRELGRFPEQPLHLRSLYLAVLLARAVWQFPARHVWPQTKMVSRLSALFSSSADPLDTRLVPAHVLLLPRRVLQVVLGGSSSLRGERT